MPDRVGLGIIGLGRWANAHAHAARRSDSVRFVSCFARTESTRQRFATDHDVAATAASIGELLADPAVEAVVVSTPNDDHAAHARMAAEAGKPVLVDKPVSVSVSEGLELWRAFDAAGIPLGVAHHARRLAGHRAAKAWIDSGDAGDVRMAYGDFSNNRSLAMKPDAWHRTARGSEAGVLIQVGIHQVDVMLYLLGPVTTVNARFEHKTLGPAMPDAAAVIMTHAGGAVSCVTSSWTTPGHYRTELLATGGNMEFRLDHGHWTSGDVDDHAKLTLHPTHGEPSSQTISKGDPLKDQLDELGRSARDGTEMSVDLVAGLRAAAVVEAAVQSARAGGGAVSIKALAEESGASPPEAAMLLGRTSDFVQVTVERPDTEAARFCIGSYFRELGERFDGGFDHALTISAEIDELVEPAGLLLVARLHGDPIGCGAIKLKASSVAEVKRMWVSPTARGLGVGRLLLTEIERHALDRGVRTLRLETNRTLTEAISLYRSAGFNEVEPFNEEPYAHHWFEKRLEERPGYT